MGADRRTGPGRALASLSLVAALECAALTGCGSTVAAKDAPAGTGVCAHAGDVDRLTISAVHAPGYASWHVELSHGLGINYRLIFTADGKLAPVTVDATGCQQVYGLGPVRWTVISPGFWSVLATAEGIGPADQATFGGTPP